MKTDKTRSFNMDCIDFMQTLPDKFYDLAIVDPPYGININISIGRRKGDKKSDYHKFAGNDNCIPEKKYFELHALEQVICFSTLSLPIG